jgi:hypothetical protein
MPEVKLQGFVGINSDDEYQMVPQPDTVMGENIVIQTTGQNQNASVKPRIGDTFSFEISNPGGSIKVYEIRTNSTDVYLKIIGPNINDVVLEGVGGNLFEAASDMIANQDMNQSFIGSPSYVYFDIDILGDENGEYVRIQTPLILAPNGFPFENPNAFYNYTVIAGNDSVYDIVCVSDLILPQMAGPNRIIGSVDYLGDTFVFSCAENRQSSSTKAVSFVSTSAHGIKPNLIPATAIVTMLNHGLQTYDSIDIFIGGSQFYSGTYTVTVIDENSFHLNGYPYVVSRAAIVNSSTDVIVTKNNRSWGEIGVFTKNYEDKETYVRLLRSSELNFRTYHQIDVEAESTLDKIALYFTDNLNKPRVFYYKGEYIEDGALQYINPINDYEYGKIDEQLRLVTSSNTMTITFVEQRQSGGNIYAGNKRYLARGLTSDFTEGFWTVATGLIPVFTASLSGAPRLIAGNTAGYQTEKVNVLRIDGIDTDLYSYLEIAVIEYLDTGYEAFILNRITLNGRKSLIYEHNGNETEASSQNSQIFNIDNKSILTALNISILDNRLLLSNIQYRSEKELYKVLETVKYELKHHKIPKQKREPIYPSNLSTMNGLDIAEYQLPDNVYNRIGYMPNETYYFSARFVFKDGFESKPIPFVKVKFDTNPSSDDGRRIAGLPSYNTIEDVVIDFDNFPGGSYQDGNLIINYIEFSSFNFNAIIDGKPARDIIERVDIMRADVSNPTVLFCGLGVLGMNTSFTTVSGQSYPVVEPQGFGARATEGHDTDFNGFDDDGYMYLPAPKRYRDVISIYSPDLLFKDSIQSFSPFKDKLIVFGSHEYHYESDMYYADGQYLANEWKSGSYIHLGGNSGWPGNGGFQDTEYLIEEGRIIETGGSYTFNTTTTFPFIFRNYHTNPFTGAQETNVSWVKNATLKLNSGIQLENDYVPQNLNQGIVRDRGYRYVQVYRENLDQYNDIDIASFVFTGSSVSPENDICQTFGGDVFLQRTTLKMKTDLNTNSHYFAADIYTHNRVNSQMRYIGTEAPGSSYPVGYSTYINWLNTSVHDELSYSPSYDSRIQGQEKLPYVASFPDDTYQPTTIVYSSIKTRGAVQDSYRNFAYSDIASLDTTYGPINYMRAMNGELYTIQERRIQRQFFNTRGVLSTSDGATALIGDGAAFYRDGVTISTMGSKHKWSVINGRSFGGNDTWYWYDDVNRIIVRFGADGIVPISTRAKFRTILRSLTDLARFNFTPADCFGIHGVWNDKLSEAVWVFRLARNYKGIWVSGIDIKKGDVYSYRPQESVDQLFYPDIFDEIPILYMATEDHVSDNVNSMVGESSSYWNQLPYGDPQYMQFFSVVFSEAQNRFISIDNIYPKIFLKNESDVYYPRTKSPVGAVLKRDSGVPLSFFNYEGDSKLVYGSVESVFNVDPNIQKKAVALRVNSELVPSSIEVKSENGQTFMLDSDFQGRLDQWDVPVLNNCTDASGRRDDTGGIFGKYIRVKFIFAPQQLQRLINMVLKFKPVSRNYNT